MSSPANLPVLVLNSSWTPITITSVEKSIMKVFSDRAMFLDSDTYEQYDFFEWIKLEVKPGDARIRTVRGHVRMPEIIILKKFAKTPEREVKLTRKNLLIRDDYRCQYTGATVSAKEATIDHIIPQSRGGKNVWENVVIASFHANTKKADRTPHEAGMKLLKAPTRPTWHPVYSRFSRIMSMKNHPPSWEKFINRSQKDI